MASLLFCGPHLPAMRPSILSIKTGIRLLFADTIPLPILNKVSR